ncbi:hypothetical protein DL96DRAFT_1596091 [Flagelloscypha sp. PMI_526]|nr:hypothetical protein DL96DRAFT_1596091 [Flagelloscypha sp. PMI_526]
MSDNTFTSRDELTKRVIPELVFSTISNPLTAPRPQRLEGLAPSKKAELRFSVEGNAIITGGTGTLGLASARGLLEHGAKGICLFDLAPSFAGAQDKISNLEKDHPNAQILKKIVDVTDEKAVLAAVKDVVAELGSVDILLCFAGVVGTYHAAETEAAQWRRLLDINTTGTWLCAQAAGNQMIKQGSGGRIVIIASVSAHRVNFPQPQVAYNASKAALLQMKSSLAAEWARYGIRTNSISPGYMDTILNEGEGLAKMRDIWNSRNPLGRMGDPSEIVGPVVTLCSQAGDYINGTDLIVDGGLST